MQMRKFVSLLLLFLVMYRTDAAFQDSFTNPPTGKIGLIVIGDKSSEISDATWIYVRAALQQYTKNRPDLLLVELNTPGGEVFAAERISDALKNFEAQTKVPVLAYVNNWAVSAGAMVAYSCRYIATSRDAIMGAAMPITMTQEGVKEAPEKVNSALRTDFASRAQFFGRNPALAEAMVDPDTIVVKRGSDIIKLSSPEDIQKGSDIVISSKGKLLTLTGKEMFDYGVAEFIVEPSGFEPMKVSLPNHPLNALPFPEAFRNDTIEPFVMDWQTKFVSFLARPAVSSLLVMALLISIYIEVSSGGFGLAAVVALMSLFFLGLVSFSQEAISWLEVLLLLFGLLLIAIEIFFVPTFGFLLVLGGIFCLVGAVTVLLPGIESVRIQGDSLNAAGEYVLIKLLWIMGATLAALLIMVLLAPPMKRRLELLSWFVLKQEPQPSLQLETEEEKVAIGDIAKVVSTLRPAGKIEIHNRIMDAVSSGEFIEAGKNVRVVEVLPGKVVVELEKST